MTGVTFVIVITEKYSAESEDRSRFETHLVPVIIDKFGSYE